MRATLAVRFVGAAVARGEGRRVAGLGRCRRSTREHERPSSVSCARSHAQLDVNFPDLVSPCGRASTVLDIDGWPSPTFAIPAHSAAAPHRFRASVNPSPMVSNDMSTRGSSRSLLLRCCSAAVSATCAGHATLPLHSVLSIATRPPGRSSCRQRS